MSAKLLAFVGSPRRGGNTDVLVDEAIGAFRGSGGTAEKISLASLQISPCQGCFSCMSGNGLDSVCVQRDDMTEIYQKIIFQCSLKANAHQIILAHNHPSGNLYPSEAE